MFDTHELQFAGLMSHENCFKYEKACTDNIFGDITRNNNKHLRYEKGKN